jgi:N-acetylglucosamine-6-phosphate deacetylase
MWSTLATARNLPPELLRLCYGDQGPGPSALITDAIRGTGLPEGPSVLGSLMDGQGY